MLFGCLALLFVPRGGELAAEFPCEGISCGCMDAETCWDNCCCAGDEEDSTDPLPPPEPEPTSTEPGFADGTCLGPPVFTLAFIALDPAILAREFLVRHHRFPICSSEPDGFVPESPAAELPDKVPIA
ncbi:MAG: hypothetical protein AAF492_10290 [Verrucomicrobiota bacterium]